MSEDQRKRRKRFDEENREMVDDVLMTALGRRESEWKEYEDKVLDFTWGFDASKT